jgi:hypothetical protein
MQNILTFIHMLRTVSYMCFEGFVKHVPPSVYVCYLIFQLTETVITLEIYNVTDERFLE